MWECGLTFNDTLATALPLLGLYILCEWWAHAWWQTVHVCLMCLSSEAVHEHAVLLEGFSLRNVDTVPQAAGN